MKVSELIEKLLGCSPDSDVVVFDGMGFPRIPRVSEITIDYAKYKIDSTIAILPGNDDVR
jgi:hypothetical protein